MTGVSRRVTQGVTQGARIASNGSVVDSLLSAWEPPVDPRPGQRTYEEVRDALLASAEIADLVETDIPLVAVYEERLFVLHPSLTAADEILLVLCWYGAGGSTRAALGKAVMRPSQTISNTLSRLISPKGRRIHRDSQGLYRITALGLESVRRAGLLATVPAIPVTADRDKLPT